jgi:3D (Asp-Asp-Asp) domain-containing protein
VKIRLAVVALALGVGCARHTAVTTAPEPPPSPRLADFEATAYSVTGTTASGMQTRRGIVAADPSVLPIGTRIRVTDAGSYSGVYTVTDTGPAVKGREIDIFMSDGAEAKRFGRRHVKVEILGQQRSAENAGRTP